MGINAIDTARVYGDGNSEAVIGKWMEAKKNRDKITLLTKGAHPDQKTMRPRISRAEILEDIKIKVNTFAVVSTTKVARMKSNIEATEILLSDEEVKDLNLQ